MFKQSEPYHDSIDLEYALLEFYGPKSKWDGMAGAFQDVAIVREAILAATSKMRSRIEEIVTADDRLLLTTLGTLESIDRDAKQLRDDDHRLLDIVAHLIDLVARLLGIRLDDWQTQSPCHLLSNR